MSPILPAEAGGLDIRVMQVMTMKPRIAGFTQLILFALTGQATASEEGFAISNGMPIIEGDDVSVSFAEKWPLLLPA